MLESLKCRYRRKILEELVLRDNAKGMIAACWDEIPWRKILLVEELEDDQK